MIKKSIYIIVLIISYFSSYAQVITFSYDANGNMTQKNNTGYFDKKAVLSAKAFLGGAYNTSTSLMSDQLRVLGLLPTTEPYTGMTGFTHIGGGGEITTPSVLAVTGNDAIVDWVFIELRDAKDSKSVLSTRSALIQRDGDIVDTDGTSPVSFYNICTGSYYVTIRHRNHLAIRTATVKALSYTVTSILDFTSNVSEALAPASGSAYNALMTMSDGKFALWGGNVNGDAALRRSGPSSVNDYSLLINYLGSNTTISNVYRREDVNMNGTVTRSGPASINDASRIANFLGVNTIINQPIF